MSNSEIYTLSDPKWAYAGLLFFAIGITYFAFDIRFHLSLLHLNLGITRKQWNIVAWGFIFLGLFGTLLMYYGFYRCEIISDTATLRLRYLLPRPSVTIQVEHLTGFQVVIPPKAPDNRQLILILKNGCRYVSDPSGPEGHPQLFSLVARLKQLRVSTTSGEKFRTFF